MATIECTYNDDLKVYDLSFITKDPKKNFSSKFKITLPSNFQYKPITSYDGFVLAVIFRSMEIGEDLTTDLPITIDGIYNCNYLIEAWNNLLPKRYKKIKLICNNIIKKNDNTSEEAISAFSGGVDACFTLIRHNEDDWGNQSSYHLKNVLCVQGFDVPTSKHEEYKALLSRISPIFEFYSCRKFEVWTDLKEKSNQDWEMSHAAQLACCFHLFSEHFKYALIGSGDSYKNLVLPWGSTPCTDNLLSSSNMQIIHDGAGYTRTEKVKRIANNYLVRERLKVCWEKGLENNCGECEKCYRTRFNFLAAGFNNPKCFNSNIVIKNLKKFDYRDKSKLVELESILEYAQQNHIEDRWVSFLKRVILKNKVLALLKK